MVGAHSSDPPEGLCGMLFEPFSSGWTFSHDHQAHTLVAVEGGVHVLGGGAIHQGVGTHIRGRSNVSRGGDTSYRLRSGL